MSVPPPPWFLRAIPTVGMALTAAYVGYKVLEHVQQQQQQTKQKVRPDKEEDMDDELRLALEMSLKEFNNSNNPAEKSHNDDKATLCDWYGLPMETALDDIPEESLPLCLEIIERLPIAVRLMFVKTVLGPTKLLRTDAQLQTLLRFLQSMEEAELADDADDTSNNRNNCYKEPYNSCNSDDDDEGAEEEEEEEFDDEFQSTNSAEVERSPLLRNRNPPDDMESNGNANSASLAIDTVASIKEKLVILLAQMAQQQERSELDTTSQQELVETLFQSLEVCPREDRSLLIQRLYRIWNCDFFPTLLSHLYRLGYSVNDTALYQLVEALIRQEMDYLHHHNSIFNTTNDNEDVGDDNDETTIRAFLEILSLLNVVIETDGRLNGNHHDEDSSSVSYHPEDGYDDYDDERYLQLFQQNQKKELMVKGFLRGLFLCSSSSGAATNTNGSSVVKQLLLRLHGLSLDRLQQVTLSFARFDDRQVFQFIETLLQVSNPK